MVISLLTPKRAQLMFGVATRVQGQKVVFEFHVSLDHHDALFCIMQMLALASFATFFFSLPASDKYSQGGSANNDKTKL